MSRKGRKSKDALTERQLHRGSKYLRSMQDILQPLMDVPSHGNREFEYHHWVGLLLLHFYNPVLNSLRSLAEATDFEFIQQLVGVKHTSLGAMSDSAAKVFDPKYLEPVLEEAAGLAGRVCDDKRLSALPGLPMAVDGTFLRCVPKMVWATFRQKTTHRGARLHLHYDIVHGIPRLGQITKALGSEKRSLEQLLEPGKLYVVDRGYLDYALYQAIHDHESFFVSRLKDNSSYEVIERRELSTDDRQAGVQEDAWVRMGSAFTEGVLTAPVRRLVIHDDQDRPVILLTNTDLSGELVGLLYRYRWQVELFFRWFKCILGCRNWLSFSRSGLTLQVYVALLASILLAVWTGLKPNRSAFRVLCLHAQGWVSDEELQRHMGKLKAKQQSKTQS